MILRRNRIHRLLGPTVDTNVNGSVVLNVLKEIKQSTKLGLTVADLKRADVEINQNAQTTNSFESEEERIKSKEQSCVERIVEAKNLTNAQYQKSLKLCLIKISRVLILKDDLTQFRKVQLKPKSKEF